MDVCMEVSARTTINIYTHARPIGHITVYYYIQEHTAGKTAAGHFNHPYRVSDTLWHLNDLLLSGNCLRAGVEFWNKKKLKMKWSAQLLQSKPKQVTPLRLVEQLSLR